MHAGFPLPDLTHRQSHHQRQYALAFGSVFSAIVALVWIAFFSSVTGGVPRLALVLPLTVIDLFALVQALLSRRSRPLEKVDLPYLSSARFWLKFYAVVACEFLVVWAALRLFSKMPNALFPVIAIVVGAHFYPLAHWMGNRLWYFTASAIFLTNVALILVVPAETETGVLGAVGASVWTAVSTSTMVIVMLVTSLSSTLMYRSTLPHQSRA